MHHMQVKAAAVKYADLFKSKGEEAAKDQMIIDGITEDDTATIIEAIKKIDNAPEAPKPTISKTPNDTVKDKFAKFDYQNLKGTSFAEYGEALQSLPANEKFDFEVFKVESIRKVRYKGVKDSPVDINGMKIKDNKPKYTTRVTPKVAILQNGRVQRDEDDNFFEVIGAQFDQVGNGLFYLLKK